MIFWILFFTAIVYIILIFSNDRTKAKSVLKNYLSNNKIRLETFVEFLAENKVQTDLSDLWYMFAELGLYQQVYELGERPSWVNYKITFNNDILNSILDKINEKQPFIHYLKK